MQDRGAKAVHYHRILAQTIDNDGEENKPENAAACPDGLGLGHLHYFRTANMDKDATARSRLDNSVGGGLPVG